MRSRKQIKHYKLLSSRQQSWRLEVQREQDHSFLLSFEKKNKPHNFKTTHNADDTNTLNQNADGTCISIKVNFNEAKIKTYFHDTELSTEGIVRESQQPVDKDVDQLCIKNYETEFWENLNSYSDDEDEENTSAPLKTWEKVATWALRHYKNRASINEILGISRDEGHTELLKDVRTLLGTPRGASKIIPCGSGTYLHYGLERALIDVFKKMPQDFIPLEILFDINLDGLPISKSSRSQLWTVLGKQKGKFQEVFVIGAYHGYEKPKSVDDYLHSFIKEYERLKETGLFYNGIKYKVTLDLPSDLR